MLTNPAAHTWACLRFPATLTSRLSATAGERYTRALIKVCFNCGYTRAHCVTGRDRYLVLVLSKSCAIIVFGIQFGLIKCHPEWIGIGLST